MEYHSHLPSSSRVTGLRYGALYGLYLRERLKAAVVNPSVRRRDRGQQPASLTTQAAASHTRRVKDEGQILASLQKDLYELSHGSALFLRLFSIMNDLRK
jgi:hypothetical protein